MAWVKTEFETIINNAQCCAADLAYKGLKEEMFTKPNRFTTYKNVRYILALVNILKKYYNTVYDIPAQYNVTFEVYPTDLFYDSGTVTNNSWTNYTNDAFSIGDGWRLPTAEELVVIQTMYSTIGGFSASPTSYYYGLDSNPLNNSQAYVINMLTGLSTYLNKTPGGAGRRARAVRTINPPYNFTTCLTEDEMTDIIQQTLELCDQCGCNSKYDIITKDI
jgi:hypothetical protein